MRKRKGFTLIEVIAVLVILAVVVLIVTPLVMNIIRKAKLSANKRSVDVYGKTVELAAVAYMLDDTIFPTSFEDLDIEYSGAYVECAINIVNMDGSAFLDKCAVNGKLVKDSKSSSGYYQYGKDTGTYMFTLYKDVNEVVNNTNPNNNININNTSSNTDTLNLEVTYNGESYFRLANVRTAAGYEVLVSEKPLSYEDAIKYAGNIPVTNVNGYGVVAYYTADNCNATDTSGCKTDYESSNVKLIIDAWAKDNVASGSTANILTTGYLTDQGYALIGNHIYQKTSTTPSNLFELGIDYWAIDSEGNVYKGSSTFNITKPYELAAIRPIVIAKSNDVKASGNNSASANSVTNNTTNPLTVDSIIMYIALAVIVICGIILAIYMLVKNDKRKGEKKDEK